MSDTHAKQAEATKAAAQKTIAENKTARETAAKEAPEPGKPTPTQEENDLAKLGVPVMEKEPDGSTEPGQAQTKTSDPKRPVAGGYQTRTAKPAENA